MDDQKKKEIESLISEYNQAKRILSGTKPKLHNIISNLLDISRIPYYSVDLIDVAIDDQQNTYGVYFSYSVKITKTFYNNDNYESWCLDVAKCFGKKLENCPIYIRERRGFNAKEVCVEIDL